MSRVFAASVVAVASRAAAGSAGLQAAPLAGGEAAQTAGKVAFASNRDGPYQISVMNPDGSDGRKLVEGTDPAWAPDGDTVAFVRDGDVYVVKADGSGERQVTDSGQDSHPSSSPDCPPSSPRSSASVSRPQRWLWVQPDPHQGRRRDPTASGTSAATMPTVFVPPRTFE